MSGKNNTSELKIDTKYSSEFSVPGLALSSTSASTVTSPCSPDETPQHQPTMTGEERSDKAKAFVQNLVGLQWDGLDNGAKIRAKKLISEDYSWSPTKHQNNIMEDNQRYKTTFREEFTKFCSLLDDKFDLNAGAAWMDGSRVFFDEQALDEYLVIRKQLSGICCLHASVVWQHYLQSLKSDRGSRDHKMLDISNFLRDKLPKHRQQQYIETGACGLGSEEFFQMITGVEDYMFYRVQPHTKSLNREMHQLDVDRILISFESFKTPGLVSMFIIEEDFHHQMVFSKEVDKAKCREYAKKKGKAKGNCIRHSMVLLGVHKDEKGEVWLLLQNFWEGNYFRLVTAEYFASCHATISWVSSPTCDVSLKDDPFVVDAEYAETDMEFEECPPPQPEEW